MPDIMIRGISLPEGELKYVTLWVYGDGRVYMSNNASAASSRKLQDLAVPIPEGHGKLGDLDKIVSFIDYYEGPMSRDTSPFKALDTVRDYICNASNTIIPAEGGSADGN